MHTLRVIGAYDSLVNSDCWAIANVCGRSEQHMQHGSASALWTRSLITVYVMLIDGSRADFLSEVDFLLSSGCYNGRMRRPV